MKYNMRVKKNCAKKCIGYFQLLKLAIFVSSPLNSELVLASLYRCQFRL